MPPNVVDPETIDPKNPEQLAEYLENLDLKQVVREKGSYQVYPEVYYPPLQPYEHKDAGHLADPKLASIYDNAEKIQDLTPHIGTEVHGIQLSNLTEQQKNDLALLVARRGVVFFKDQDIRVKKSLDLGRHYGPLHIHNVGGHPPHVNEVLILHIEHEKPQIRERLSYRSPGDGWHSDVSYELQPGGLAFLKIDTLPGEAGGDTLWASGYEAYDRLSPAWKTFLEGLEAIHSGDVHRETARVTGQPLRREAPDNAHPVIRTHPVTGWKSLFVNRGFTRRIVGFTRRESDAVLNFLFDHIETGIDFQVRFKWTEDTVAVWDNRVTYHNPVYDYFGGKGLRHGYRVSPSAERPYFDPKSKSRREALAEEAEKNKA